MKKPHHRIAVRTAVAIGLAAFLSATASLHAQILVGASGAPADPFDVIPLNTSWSTFSIGGASNIPEDNAAMDTAVQLVPASSITTGVESNNGNPPGTSANSRWSSTGFYLQTRPTGNAATLLMATLMNNSGGNVNSMTINYDYVQRLDPAGVATELITSHRVYYSLSGATDSWVPLGNFGDIEIFNTPQPISIPLDLTATPWVSGTPLYLVFADDNSEPNTDAANGIDNFAVGNVVGGELTCVAITNQSGSLTVAERGTAIFSISATGTPQTIRWFRDGVQIPGAGNPTYTLTNAVYPTDNGATFFATVSNAQCQVQSTTVTLTVLPDTTAPTVVSAVGGLDPTIVTVTFSEAVDFNTISEGTATVFITGTDPANGLLTQGFYLTNNNTTVVFTTEPRQTGSNYSVLVTGVLDASSQQNPQVPDPITITLQQTIALIALGDEWKYDINNGDLFGTGWETVGYDDSAWPMGAGPLGLDASAGTGVQPAIVTPLPYGATSAPTYFRRHFLLPTGTNGLVLTLRHVIEDGAVYYINGQEAGRFRVGAGALTFATRSSAAAPDPTPIEGPFNLPTTNVVPGDNVIAVVVIQSGATSSDIEFAAEITTTVTNFSSGPPVITTQPQTQTVNERQSVTFTVVADGSQPITYQWRSNGVDIAGATASSYTINSATAANNGVYSVFLSNSAGTATSANATLTVNPDLTGPTFLSAVANTNLTEILLTFSEPLDSANAQNIAHYAVQLTAGGGALTVGSATLVNGTNVLLTTTPRTQSQNYTITINGVTDTAAAQNLATPTSRAVIADIIILAPNDVTLWRYESSSNNLDGLGWQLPGFNDSAWPTALAGFTTSNNLEITTNGFELRSTNMLAPSSGGPITAYYRVPFNFPGSTAGATLHLVGVVDDGLVAYINGVEAGRLRITNASPVSFTNLATGAGPETTDVHLPLETIVLTNLSGLVSGANLLAIELHQNSATSSDSVLSVQLVAGLQSFADLGPRLHIVLNGNGTVTVSWSGPGTLQQTSALLPSGTVWTDVPGNPNPYTSTPATGQARFFSLRQ